MVPPTRPHGDHLTADVSFPRLYARTGRFTLGEPRAITVTPDGHRVLFVRTASGVDRTGLLWAFDVETGRERLLADPADLLGDGGEQLSDAERSRRERARESGAGIVAYSTDDAGLTAVFALSGALWACDIATAQCRALPAAGPVVDPRIDPTGRRVAYASGGALRVLQLDSFADRAVAEPDCDEPAEADVVWGQAEFVAAEELGRFRGYWWAPDGESLLVERYDNAPVGLWHIADPANPEREPVRHRYPAAGTANAMVSLWHVTVGGSCVEVPLGLQDDRYLARVSWTSAGAVAQTLSRDQRDAEVWRLHLPDATTELIARVHSAAWLDVTPGLPALTPDGRLLTVGVDRAADSYRLLLDGEPLTSPGMQFRAVLHVADGGVLATVVTEPAEQQLVRVGYDGSVRVLSTGRGVHTGAAAADTVVIASSSLDTVSAQVVVYRDDSTVSSGSDNEPGLRECGRLATLVAPAPFTPSPLLLTVGERDLQTALVLPRDHSPGSRRLPILMAPYGGPHAQLVRASARMFLQAQWLADQGFAVIVADGRGTPGRGPAWEYEIQDQFAAVTLQDQVDALAGVAASYPDDLDTGRVGIMGWSYGGYLSALAVLERPDVFHAAVAGAPVTDWTLYDTCYTERYLGDPRQRPDVYERNSLIAKAPQLRRPLLLIHGLADDNVVVAHTLRLSGALLAAGRAHEVLPLTGITHMAASEVVAENLLLAQVDFFRRAFG